MTDTALPLPRREGRDRAGCAGHRDRERQGQRGEPDRERVHHEESQADTDQERHQPHGATQQDHLDLDEQRNSDDRPSDRAEHPELGLTTSNGDEGRLTNQDHGTDQHQGEEGHVLCADGAGEPDGHALLPPRFRHDEIRPAEPPGGQVHLNPNGSTSL